MTTTRIARTLAAALVMVLVMATAACTPVAGRNDDLGKALRRGVTLLEAGKERAFLEEYMIPYQRQHQFGELTDERIERFRKVNKERLLGRLKAAEKVEPTLNASRTEAIYPIDPELKLMRVDGIWRIAD